MKNTFLTILFSCFFVATYAKGDFEITTNIKTAYAKILELRLTEAGTILRTESRVNSDNLMVEYLENYIDCIQIFISEDEKMFDKLEPKKYSRLTKIEKGNSNSEYYLHAQAMMRIHWLLARSKFGESITSIRELKKAGELFEKNQSKFPNFIGNKHGLGIIHATVGAIPDDYSWGKSLLGLSGNLTQGFRELNEVINYSKTKDYLFEEEAILMTAYLQIQFSNDKEDAWRTMRSNRISTAKSPIAAYVKALVGIQTGHSESAISILANSKPKGEQYAIPQWDLLYGTAKLYRLDKDADYYLKRFVNSFKGRNQIKIAYKKLAEHALIFKSESSFKYYINKGKNSGNESAYGDKDAQNFMESGDIPDLNLLKADLLLNGGFSTKSLAILETNTNYSGIEKVEHFYIKGRNYQAQNNATEAIKTFKELLDLSESRNSYFACSAALQIGLIYEQKRLKSTAKGYFEKCLEMSSNRYESSLHAKAKAGLNRVK